MQSPSVMEESDLEGPAAEGEPQLKKLNRLPLAPDMPIGVRLTKMNNIIIFCLCLVVFVEVWKLFKYYFRFPIISCFP